MDTFESALKSWDFILFDERTFRIIITHRKNSSPNLAHIHDFEIWERITKIKVGNKIMRVNGDILNLEEIWSCFTQKIIKNSSWRTPRQHFACQNEKIQNKKKMKNDENWYCAKIWCKGRSTFRSGAKHIYNFQTFHSWPYYILKIRTTT